MARVLVVYYSRTGTTKKVALGIARALSADLEQIADPRPRDGVLGYVRSIFDVVLKRCTRIVPPRLSPSLYDVVVIGSPTWGASISSPIRTYVTQECSALPAVAFFSTYDGRGGDRVLAEMAEVSGRSPVATLALRGAEVEDGSAVRKVERFAEAVQATLDELRRGKAASAPAAASPSAA